MTAPIRLSRRKAGGESNALWNALNDFLAFADPTDLSGVHRIASLAYNHWSRVRLGGFHDYFSTNSQNDYPEIELALRSVGAAEVASVLASALAAVHEAGKLAPDDYSDRFMAGLEYTDLIEFDDAFERCSESFPICLVDFVDKYESEFIEWIP